MILSGNMNTYYSFYIYSSIYKDLLISKNEKPRNEKVRCIPSIERIVFKSIMEWQIEYVKIEIIATISINVIAVIPMDLVLIYI